MGYKVNAPASTLFDSAKTVNAKTMAFVPVGDDRNWSITDAKTDEVRFTGPTGFGTPTSLVLHLNQIQDWYKGKSWVDASAIPAVRSATRINATYTENLYLQDTANVLDTKVLPVQASLNITVPNCDNLMTDGEVLNLFERCMGALLCSVYSATPSESDAYVNLANRLLGVLKPEQFSGE